MSFFNPAADMCFKIQNDISWCWKSILIYIFFYGTPFHANQPYDINNALLSVTSHTRKGWVSLLYISVLFQKWPMYRIVQYVLYHPARQNHTCIYLGKIENYHIHAPTLTAPVILLLFLSFPSIRLTSHRPAFWLTEPPSISSWGIRAIYRACMEGIVPNWA